MMFLIGFFLSISFVHAESLQLLDMHYNYPVQTASCGLLKHRERERQKVIRELKHAELLQGDNLLLNKLFMPGETWRDLSAEVILTVQMTEPMIQEASSIGVQNLYLSVEAPGFVWQSFAFQIPNEMHINVDVQAKFVHIRYLTYFNVLCLDKPKPPVVEWVHSKDAPTRPNTWDLLRVL